MSEENTPDRYNRAMDELERLDFDQQHRILIDGAEQTNPDQFDIADADARKYLAASAGGRLSWSTVQSTTSKLRTYVNYLQDERGKSVSDADIDDVAAFLFHCAIERENRIGTINSHKGNLKSLYDHLELTSDDSPSVTSRQIDGLRTELLEKYVPKTIQREPLTREEVRKLLSQKLTPRNRLMIKVCYQTAMRNRDVRELRIENVDFDDQIVRVEFSKGSKCYQVPITAHLALEIEDYVDTRLKAISSSENEYLFPSRLGGHLKTHQAFASIVSKAAEDAGIQKVLGKVRVHDLPFGENIDYVNIHKVTPHALRHSILTHLKDENVSDEYRKEFAGHANVQTTLDYYTHVGEADLLRSIRTALSSIN